MTSNKERRQEAMETLNRELKNRERKEKNKPLTIVAASLAVILAIVGGIWFLNNQSDSSTTTTDAASTTETTTPEAPQPEVLTGKRATPLPETVTCAYDQNEKPAKDVGLPPTENVPATGTVDLTIDTNAGEIPLTLDRAASPCTVNAITYLASKNYYDDTVCHRITTAGIKVLQCGDPSGTGAGGPGFTYADEYPVDEQAGAPVTYPRGSVAMANAGPSTNGSQFFLNYGDSPLAASYSYFGTINDAGLTTLDAIAAKGAQGGAPDGRPAEEVKINKVTVK